MSYFEKEKMKAIADPRGFCGFDCIKFRFFGFGYIRLD